MITTEQESQTIQERIAKFQTIVQNIRSTEANPANYRASASGFLAEIDKMQLEVREYLERHPSELLAQTS